MTETLDFTTTLTPQGPAAAIELTDEQVALLGAGAKAFPVVVAIEGRELRLRVARRGGANLIGFSKAARAEAGVDIGAEITVRVWRDDAAREVDVPQALAEALALDEVARARFDALAPSHRKEYARWVGEAKKADTRDRRVAQTLERLRADTTR